MPRVYGRCATAMSGASLPCHLSIPYPITVNNAFGCPLMPSMHLCSAPDVPDTRDPRAVRYVYGSGDVYVSTDAVTPPASVMAAAVGRRLHQDGRDSRKRVTNVGSFPWRTVGWLGFDRTASNETAAELGPDTPMTSCTATKIDENTILTAAHVCVRVVGRF
jgi:hypothetical protein